MDIGIIGGKGKMGTWFAEFFARKGHKIRISDIGTGLTNTELVQESEVVILAVPISAAQGVIQEIVPALCPAQLLMDILAVKTPAVRSMLASKAEIVSIHPMFGPDTKSISGQTMIVCDIRSDRWKGWVERTFKGARIKHTTADQHDWNMSIIQGMTHFSLIALGHALGNLGIDVEKSLEYTSPIYRIRIDMVGRILSQDPRVYSEISLENPDVVFSVSQLMKSSQSLFDVIKRKDKVGFESLFIKASDKLGRYTKQAAKESEFLIESMAKHKINNMSKIE